MLRELLEHQFTPCVPYARKMGYLYEVIATKARYKRCADAWMKHLKQTREFIVQSAESAVSKRKIMILGAGNCYDIPLAQLSQMFEQVVLVDMAFLRSTKRLAKKYGAVCVQADITGAAEHMLGGDLQAALAAKPDVFHDDGEVDMVVSANVMSQLPMGLLPYLEGADEQGQFDFCSSIIASHMEYLKGFSCPVCLVTDVMYFYMQGQKVQTQKALCGFEPPECDKLWRWDIAPHGESAHDVKEWHQVGALVL